MILKLLKRLFKRHVLYIHSNDMLPPPLDEESERKYLEEVKNGSIEARNVLIEHNLRLVVYIAKKFEGTNVNIEDLISIGSMGLIKGVQTFNVEKNIKLATYASRCIENEILMFLRKISKSKNEVSLDETLNVDRDGNELLLSDILGTDTEEIYNEIEGNEKQRIMYEAIESLKPREKEIISLRFGLYDMEALTQRDVAIFLGISQSYISRLEKRIIRKLKQELESKLSFK